jgi:mRNA interferase RelE/StbE
MSYHVVVTPKAHRQIKALPRHEQQRVNQAVKTLRENPRPDGVKKLHNSENLYRLRVGDYRVVHAIIDKVLIVIVVTVGHRKEVYNKLVDRYTPEKLLTLIAEDL